MLEYTITAATTGSVPAMARCKEAELALATDLAGRPDTFSPAELLLTAGAPCPALHGAGAHGPRSLRPLRALRRTILFGRLLVVPEARTCDACEGA